MKSARIEIRPTSRPWLPPCDEALPQTAAADYGVVRSLVGRRERCVGTITSWWLPHYIDGIDGCRLAATRLGLD